ncbi:MAG: tRNA pseudouridine(38-40) synthase TruA [Ferruginibacter sp.]
MRRYFIEVAYKGTLYSGFQIQQNANSIQAEVEKALETFFRRKFILTCSSRTDAGVHALQNFFHFDTALIEDTSKAIYHLNAILPEDIVVKAIRQANSDAHARFDARSREYIYYVHQAKDPFMKDRSYYFPYKVNIGLLEEAAAVLMQYDDFTSFSKRNTQVKSFICSIMKSEWHQDANGLSYQVEGNRFLRGMVRGLTATMLKVGQEKISLQGFKEIIEGKDAQKTKFDVPAQGLFLVKVNYPENIFITGG